MGLQATRPLKGKGEAAWAEGRCPLQVPSAHLCLVSPLLQTPASADSARVPDAGLPGVGSLQVMLEKAFAICAVQWLL